MKWILSQGGCHHLICTLVMSDSQQTHYYQLLTLELC